MESLLIGSSAMPSSLPPFGVTAELCSSSSGEVFKCKRLSNLEIQLAVPMMISHKQLPMRVQLSKFVAFSQKRSDNCSMNVASEHTFESKPSKSPLKTLPKCEHVSKFVARSRKGSDNCLVNAASEHTFESEPSKSPLKPLQQSLDAFYRFSRPHTVIGTVLSIISVSLLAVEKLSDFSPLFFTGMVEAIVAAFFMNIYIVGLNQLSDIDIDKVNKPYLPLASGEYSIKTGVIIVSSFALMGFWLACMVGSRPLFCALFVSFVLGTAYSINVPLLRWKRFAFVAALCILAVRAVIVQLAFYLHIQTFVFGRTALLTKPVIFATAFMSFFSVVIALFKDIPDIVGDKIYGIRSFTVRLGQEKVFWICIAFLQMAYVVAILVGLSSSQNWSKFITVVGHILLSSLLWSRAKTADLGSKAGITSFYMFIWQLFYAEYFLIPLVR